MNLKLPLLLAALLFAAQAHADDRWTNPYPGVRHLFRTTADPNRIHAVFVDLCTPGLTFMVTPEEERGRATSRFAQDHGLTVAINGGFYNTANYAIIGLTMSDFARWPDGADNASIGFLATGADSRARISLPSQVVAQPEYWMQNIVSGMPMLVRDGAVMNEACDAVIDHLCERHPRTAVGITQDNGTLIMVTVDGRWTGVSRGMTRDELARLMINLGAYQALNLDGGGSTTMYVANEGGVQNHPSDGSERRVSNHLGLVIRDGVRFSSCCSVTPAAGPQGLFVDLPQGNWAQEAAETLFDEGITRGCQADPLAFCPNCAVNRASAAIFLARAMGLAPVRPANPTFVDVPADLTGYGEIEALVAAGVTSGCSQNPRRFCPLGLLTRAEAITLIVRAAGLTLGQANNRFTDVPANVWYAPYIATAADACIVNGCAADRFCPDQQVSRAEMAAMLVRGMELGEFHMCIDEPADPDAGVSPPDAWIPPERDAWIPPDPDAWVPPEGDAWVPPDPTRDAWVPPDPTRDAWVPPDPTHDAAIHPDDPDSALRLDASPRPRDASSPDGPRFDFGLPPARQDAGEAGSDDAEVSACQGSPGRPSSALWLLLLPLLGLRRRR